MLPELDPVAAITLIVTLPELGELSVIDILEPAAISSVNAESIFVSIRPSIALVVATFVSSVVCQDSVLITVGSPVSQALSTLSLDSWFTYKFCSVLSFKSLALIADPG